jgi:hypothetical protein
MLYAAALTSLACNASAQAPRPDEHPPAAAPKACAPGERLQPGQGGPKVPETTGQNLSDKLARNEGVLCPPNVDPNIKAPTPETGKMPVIPPPGSPGGDQSVKPT